MPRPPCADDMSQQLNALRQQLLQARETQDVAAVLLPRVIELLLSPTPVTPAWTSTEPALPMSPSSHAMESLLIHSKASTKFVQILQQHKPPPAHHIVAAILRAAAAILVGSDIAVSRIWLDMLVQATDIVPVDIVRSEILPIAVRQSQAWNNTWARISACHLFGKVCVRLESHELQSEVVPGLVALCQDVAWEVRSAACDQLVHATSCVGASPMLLSTLCELGADESEAVLVSVVGATASSLKNLPPDTLVTAITPLVMRLAREAAREGSPVLLALAAHYGDLFYGLRGYMSPEERSWLVDMYQNMVRMGLQRVTDTIFVHLSVVSDNDNMIRWSQQIRCFAAASLPVASHFLLSEDRRDVLLGIIRDLVFDPHPPVRCSLAAGLHKIAVALGADTSGLLRYDLIRLLCDQNIDVLRALMPNVAPFLLLMKEGKTLDSEDMSVENVATCAEVLHGLLTCEATVVATLDWRLYVDLAAQYEVLPQCLPSDFIYDAVLSLLLQRIVSVRQLPSRCALSRTVLVLLRFIERPEHRDDIRNKLVENLMKNKNSYHRMCYLRLCSIAMDIFSQVYFKIWFFDHVISLSEDSVATIRQVAAGLFPSMKTMCQLPEDKNLLEMLDSALKRLLEDSDREVLSVAKSAHYKLVEIKVSDLTSCETDAVDKQRLEEELAVEQKKPPDNWLQSEASSGFVRSNVMSEQISKLGARAHQPPLKMSDSTRSTSTANDIWLKIQPIRSTQTRTLHTARPSYHGQSSSTNSSQDLQGRDFVVDAGIQLPEKQTTHIPSPRRGHNQRGHLQNRKSWAGASSPKSGFQVTKDSVRTATTSGMSEVSLLDTGQTNFTEDLGNQGATAVTRGNNSQASSPLHNVKATSTSRALVETTFVGKNKSSPLRGSIGKPARASSSLPGSPVIMRSGRDRSSRDSSHRNSVAAMPVRGTAENVQNCGWRESEDCKTSAVRRRSGQFFGGKTAGSGRPTHYTSKRNSAFEIQPENVRGRLFTGRKSATFERLADCQASQAVTRTQKSSAGLTIGDPKDTISLLVSPSTRTVQEKQEVSSSKIEGRINVSALETKDTSEIEEVNIVKDDNSKKQLSRVNVYNKGIGNAVVNKRENNFEDNISLLLNVPKVLIPTDETKLCISDNQQLERGKGESNETAIGIGYHSKALEGDKTLKPNVGNDGIAHRSNTPGRGEARNSGQTSNGSIAIGASVDALDKLGARSKTINNNKTQKITSERRNVNHFQVRIGTRESESQINCNLAPSTGVSSTNCNSTLNRSGIRNSIMAEETLVFPQGTSTGNMGIKQDTYPDAPDKTHINVNQKTAGKGVTLNEQGACFDHIMRRDTGMADTSNDQRKSYAEKVDATAKQISRRSCHLDHYVPPRHMPTELRLLANAALESERQHSPSVAPSERRININRHSLGAVLATPIPPRRHSSLDRLGGPKLDLSDDSISTARGGSCHSSPTSGLPASRLPIRRQQP